MSHPAHGPHEPHCFEGHVGGEQWLRSPGHIFSPKAGLQQSDPLSVCRATMIRTSTHKLVRRPLERRLLDWYVRTADVTPFDENPRGFSFTQ